MSNLSTSIRYDRSATANPELWDLKVGAPAEYDNADFLAEVSRRLRALAGTAGTAGTQLASEGVAAIGLIGEYGPVGYALRRAQEAIRLDRTPSYWSHAFLFLDALNDDPAINRNPETSPRLLECSLEPSRGLDHFAFTSGVSVRRFAEYANSSYDLRAPHSVPNIAVICVSLGDAERQAVLERALLPEMDQLGYDLPRLLAKWFTFVANRWTERNPLARGVAIPGAAYAQLAYDGAGIDLSPGSHNRNTAPEHLWQSARFLYSRFEVLGENAAPEPRRVVGFHCVRDPAGSLAPVGVNLPKSLRELLAL